MFLLPNVFLLQREEEREREREREREWEREREREEERGGDREKSTQARRGEGATVKPLGTGGVCVETPFYSVTFCLISIPRFSTSDVMLFAYLLTADDLCYWFREYNCSRLC